jgi:uncharacterized SAM-binding protein YcdF (DUF218 family)
MTDTSVIIPAFNEARTIREVVAAVRGQAVDRVIVVDDGSTDTTAELVRASLREGTNPPLELLQHQTNLGKGFALQRGIAHALASGAQRIVTMDGDGQHSASDIPRLLQAASLDPDAIVIAARTEAREQAPPLRRFANEVADFWISWACGRRIEDTQSGFRLYPAGILARLIARPRGNQGFAYETELLIDAVAAGARVRHVAIATCYHQDLRPSHYRPWRDTWSIVRLVGGKLLRRGMYPLGLLRSLGWRSRPRCDPLEPQVRCVEAEDPIQRQRLDRESRRADSWAFCAALNPLDDMMATHSRIDWDNLGTLALTLLVGIVGAGLPFVVALVRVIAVGLRAGTGPATDLIVVFGKRLVNDQPDRDYRIRLATAARLAAARQGSRILLLGGRTGNARLSEAEAGEQLLRALPEGASLSIGLEQASRDTLTNLRNLRTLLAETQTREPLTLISNRYHLARLGQMANSLGLSYRLCAAASITPWSRSVLPHRWLLESFYVTWFATGKLWARLTRNRRMLARVS